MARTTGRTGIGLWVLLGWLAAVGYSAPALGVSTGYVDEFSGPMRGWAQSRAYTPAQGDGVVEIAVNKQTKWDGQYLHLGEKHDFSQSPFVNLRLKADSPCILHVYMHDGEASDLLDRKVRVVDGFVTLSYDFSGAQKVDLTQVQGLIFTANGAANSWTGTLTFDELRVGDRAVRLAGIEGMADQVHYRDSGRREVLLSGLWGTRAVELTGGEGLIRDARVDPTGVEGQGLLSYECVPGAAGAAEVTLTALGLPGYEPNSVPFTVTVEDNLPPTVDAPADLTALAGRAERVPLSGISDGNVAAEQPISFSLSSSDPAVLPAEAMAVAHSQGSPYATLELTPRAPGAARVTIALDDGAEGDSAATTAFNVRAVQEWNNPPTVDPVADMIVLNDAAEQTVALTGIGDGDDGRQPVEISATTSNPDVIRGPIRVDYAGGETATIAFSPAPGATGTSTIAVTVADRGGSAENNGDRQTQVSFDVATRQRPVSGLTVDFADWPAAAENWRTEAGIQVSGATVDGRPALEIQCRDKVTFGGLWFSPPDLDLSECPHLAVDVRPEDELQFNMFFYDGTGRRNSGASQTKTVQPGRWQTVTFDFSGEGQMADGESIPLQEDWVTQVLFNLHPRLGWPFTHYTGTIHFRNLRIGAAADVPARPPVCTVYEVPDQVHLAGAGRQQVELTGIGNGAGGPASLSVTSSNPALLGGLTLGAARAEGATVVSYEAGEAAGSARLQVTASAEGSEPASVAFSVEVLDADPARAASVMVDASQQHQTIYGFGTFSNNLPPELYAGELGASAMRVGLIANQIETSNENSDPEVLHRGGLSYGAFDFDHYRALHEAGVETFILSSWSPPAWMKANLSLNYQQGGMETNSDRTLNRLDYHQYEEFAESMVAAVLMFREEAGIELAAIGLQNEPAFHEPYASAILDARRFVELIKVVGPRFEREGISARLFMPEQVFTQTRSMNQYIDALNADPVAQRYCDIVATHGYDARGVGEARPTFPAWQAMWQRSQQGAPKEMWMTETYPSYRGWDSAFNYALYLYGSLEHGNIGLWTSWSISGQLLTQGQPNDAFYTCSQFWRDIRPGARRVASASSDGQVLATSYVNDAEHGGRLVSVLINNAQTARAVRLEIGGAPAPDRFSVTRTDRVNHRAEVGALAAGELLLLPPRSVTTVVAE